jgi:hypothetical protein
MLQLYKISLQVYAESEEEARQLEADLLEFVQQKYNQGVYPRAASLSRLIKQYGNNAIVSAFIK